MQLHEQTRRFILLSIFFLFGPVLTLGIIGGIVVRKLPSNARQWERNLSQQTGLQWSVKSIEYCSPRLVRLHDVKILDDTAEQPVFRAEKMEIKLVTDSRRSKIFPGIVETPNTEPTGLTAALESILPTLRTGDQFWQITASVSLLNFGKYSSEDSAALVKNMLGKIFARFDSLADVPVLFVFDQIVVVSEYSQKKGGEKIEDTIDIFRSVQGSIFRTPTEIRSDWFFQIKDISELDWEHRERLSFTLSLTDSLEISFRSGRQPIPCDLAAVFCAPFKRFSGGSFQGEFSYSTRPGNNAPTTRLNKVVFTNVPLAPLVRPHIDFAVEGTLASLKLTTATFGAEGCHAEGGLQVINGTLQSALLHRCIDRFQLRIDPESILNVPDPMIPFSACTILFRLQPGVIDFWADQTWRDALMYYRNEKLNKYVYTVYLPPQRRPVTYYELMSVFAPDNAPVVPLTPKMQSVLQHIPIQ